ncbi:hypothetical protein BDN70DRAFT_900917 [Pholiota conissans]|uniref:Uncharacterized protein n=1 Tax=Pholiota conissans TaxID=109636 RepID=A0A9P5YLF2_9AGAR|nr:hypothetical protein BDN70DRAFT_900917 [Pholiota conissans]
MCIAQTLCAFYITFPLLRGCSERLAYGAGDFVWRGDGEGLATLAIPCSSGLLLTLKLEYHTLWVLDNSLSEQTNLIQACNSDHHYNNQRQYQFNTTPLVHDSQSTRYFLATSNPRALLHDPVKDPSTLAYTHCGDAKGVFMRARPSLYFT